MLQMIRINSYTLLPSFLMFLCLPIVLDITHLPTIPFATYLMFLYIFLATPFYLENMKHVDRFIISLPISKLKIVLARYIVIIVLIITGTGFILWFETTFHQEAIGNSAIVIAGIYTMILTIVAVGLPALYYFEKMWEAILLQVLIFIAGNIVFFIAAFSSILDVPVNIVLSVIDLNPYLILSIVSVLFISISYMLSVRIYARKDH